MQQNRTFRSSSGWSGLYLILAMLIMSSYTGQKNPVDATIRQLQVPVLKFRQNNPVLQIKLSIPADTPSQKVTSFTITTDGTEDLSDIKAVRVWFMGKDSLWVKYEKASEKAGGPRFGSFI